MMKKKISVIVTTIATCIVVLSMLTAASPLGSYLFKGTLVLNNNVVVLKQSLYKINGTIYVPLRAFTEQLKGNIAYDKQTETVYIEQQLLSNKKSTINKKSENESFTLHSFSTKDTYKYGEPIEIWSRLTNHSNETIDIEHGEALIDFIITDEQGFTSTLTHGLALSSSSFQAGDEWLTYLKPAHFIAYNFNR